ncbi:MAG: hypothetical protein WCW35_08480 [Bacteroidota bacterium]|jgi:hypothetical protein
MNPPFHRQIALLTGIFYRPAATFHHLKVGSSLVIPVIILILLTLLSGELISPYKKHIIVTSLTEQMGETRARETVSQFGALSFILKLLAPVPTFVRVAVIACLMLIGDMAFRKTRLHYTMYFSATVYVEFILVLKDYIKLFFLYCKGIENMHTFWDLHLPIGLELLLPNWPEHIVLFTIASNVNIFVIWYVTVLTEGLATISTLRRWKAFVIVSGIWLLGIGFQVMISIISTEFMKMSGR